MPISALNPVMLGRAANTKRGAVVSESGYRYYRLNITSPNGGANIGSSEFELYEVEGGSNMALGRPTLVSQSYAYVEPNGAELVDGITTNDWDTGWLTDAGITSGWCSVQLASRKPVYKFRVGAYPTPNDPAGKSTRDFTFEGSNDNSNWTVLKTVTGCYVWAPGTMRSFLVGTPPAFRYYRLNCDRTNGDINFTGILEWEIYETVGGPNVALGKTATASRDDQGAPPSRAFDGLFTAPMGWLISAGSEYTRQWIQVDLGAAKTLGYYRVGSYPTTNTTAARSFRQWEILGSNDNSEWYHISSVQNQTGWTFGEMRSFTP